MQLPVHFEIAVPGAQAQSLRVSGLLGGHSGLNINEDRGNANIMLALLVDKALQKGPRTRLAGIKGGDKRNAIAREASALLLVSGYSICCLALC